jgi:glycosyltransferase involved in cell wall biosynthesis
MSPKAQASSFPPAPASLPPLPAALDAEPCRALRREMALHAEASMAQLPASLLAAGGQPRLTVVVLSWNAPERTQAALASLHDFARLPYRLLVIDNNSDPAAKPAVRAACRTHGAELVEVDRNLGCAGGRQLGVDRATTEYVMFLDNDAEVFPGTLEHLVHALDSDPGAVACCGSMVLPDGRVQLCGADYVDDGVVLTLAPLGRDLRFDDPRLGSSGPCRWVPGGLLVVRRSVLASCPLDIEMSYFEDNEWSFRVQARWPGSLRRSVAALALHHQIEKGRRGSGLAGVGDALPYVAAAARFYRLHGRILDGLFVFVPELAAGGRRDVASARLLLELIAAKGTDWVLRDWLSGGLAPLFRSGPEAEMRRDLAASQREVEAARAGGAVSEERLRQTSRQLAMSEERLRQTSRRLAAIHGSRLWRAANAYWSVRRALGAVLSRLLGGR